jgi:hypothetical protein
LPVSTSLNYSTLATPTGSHQVSSHFRPRFRRSAAHLNGRKQNSKHRYEYFSLGHFRPLTMSGRRADFHHVSGTLGGCLASVPSMQLPRIEFAGDCRDERHDFDRAVIRLASLSRLHPFRHLLGLLSCLTKSEAVADADREAASAWFD